MQIEIIDLRKRFQEEKYEIDPSNKVWEENFPTADEHLDKMDDLEKNKKEDAGEQ